MPDVAIEILPLETPWDECPARGNFDTQVAISTLTPLDLDWPEHWVEAFLAEQQVAVHTCLGASANRATVWRQLADMDLVFLDHAAGSAILVELKKQGPGSAKEAVCQLARNFAKARRVLRPHGVTDLHAVVCGTWREQQIQNARDTVAWHYLEGQGAKATALVYSGAFSQDGRLFLVAGEGKSPFLRKGKRNPDDAVTHISAKVAEASKKLPPAFRLTLNRLPSSVILRFTANKDVRDEYLGSNVRAEPRGAVETFLRVKSFWPHLGDRAFVIGQRLELRAEYATASPARLSQSDVETLLDKVLEITGAREPRPN